jgi:hypothetical protein
MTAEHDRVDSFGRLDLGLRQASEWYLWGPYLSERQWGTVREDYSPDGDAWNYLPHEHARSRAYRWGEDGLAGFSDIEQRLCLSLTLWNGRDPILKERAYGLTGPEGNHGEDVKEYWWYTDAVPSHAWNSWRYHYPQGAFPYERLRAENARRGKLDPEFELLDTGAFDDDRYWIVEVDYAKGDPGDILMTVRVTNAGPSADEIHVLPTLWFRNTWSWDVDGSMPLLKKHDDGVAVPHPYLGDMTWQPAPASDGTRPELLFCDNTTNTARLFDSEPITPWPKDGINDHVISGAPTVNPAGAGSKCAAWYKTTIPAGETVEFRLRLSGDGETEDFDQVVARRRAEADDFYAALTPPAASQDEALVMRQAFAGLLWSKQLYAYDVARWLDGDPAQPPPPEGRDKGRNAKWRNLEAFDLMSMPDNWEYPWFASWDLAFHCVALAHVDPAFAKYQLLLLCREWFQHADGALPAYEWDFSDVNPPVQAWAALEVFTADGGTDFAFLSRVFDKLLMNFTWWVNQQDSDGSDTFEGGFLGLDNIGPLDRSHLPVPGRLEQADATGWMAMYALSMGTIAAVLHASGHRVALDLVQTFLERFAEIRFALEKTGMWDDTDGLFYDRIVTPGGAEVPVKVRSMVGIIPMLAVGTVDEKGLDRSLTMGKSFARFLSHNGLTDPGQLVEAGLLRGDPGDRQLMVGVLGLSQVRRMFETLFDPAEFLSPYGLRSLSAHHRHNPYVIDVEGTRATVDYEPAESTVAMFGGNSNWRGPIWFPLNYLVASSLEQYHRFLGADFTIEYPSGSGRQVTLDVVADDLWRRLTSIFLVGPDGRRPCYGGPGRFQSDPRWRDNVLFHEYFHGDNGAGLGATHQTGWTGLIAAVIRRRYDASPSAAETIQRIIANVPSADPQALPR